MQYSSFYNFIDYEKLFNINFIFLNETNLKFYLLIININICQKNNLLLKQKLMN